MKIPLLALYVGILIALTAPLAAQDGGRSFTPSKEIVLAGYHTEILSKDLPAAQILFDPSGALWVAGKNCLWRWAHSEQRLHKICLPAGAPAIRQFTFHADYLYAATDHNLYRVKPTSGELLKYQFPKTTNAQAQSLALIAHSSGVWWLRQDGLLRVKADSKAKTSDFLALTLPANAKAWLDADNRLLWMIRDDMLLVRDLRLKAQKNKLVHKARHRLLAIHGAGDNVLVHTNHTTLRFDQSLKLVQAIPVEGGRKLVAVFAAKNRHAFLFDDRLLEQYDLEVETRSKTFLDIEPGKTVSGLAVHDQLVGTLANGTPRLFRLDGRLHVATKEDVSKKL